MKIVSFNINGLRARPHQLQAIIDSHQPAVIGLQETKVDDPQFPEQMIHDMGYQVAYHGQKGHYGVALVYNAELLSLEKGFPTDPEDAQRRMIIGRFKTAQGAELTVLNGYFPQGENRAHETKFPYKEKFYTDLMAYLQTCAPDQHLLVMGDFNISPTDADIGIGDNNRKRWLQSGKCSFLPEEREWYETLMAWGLTDTFRQHYPEIDNRFSWFDYRSRGFDDDPKRGLRIDHILATEKLAALSVDAGIDYALRGMEKPSDHAPIWTEFDLK